ncbi:hypothetical protein D3C84_1093360 [compost metagenome]
MLARQQAELDLLARRHGCQLPAHPCRHRDPATVVANGVVATLIELPGMGQVIQGHRHQARPAIGDGLVAQDREDVAHAALQSVERSL